ncbi:MAG: type II CAAX prenyl endopeptidase Rce1 family protein, partial [Planctomycetia bacterium]
AAALPATTLLPLQVDFPDGGESPARQATREVVPVVAGAVLVLLALLTATGAFYPAIDAIAGEKERGTVETLLIAPCGVADIVRGKFLAVFAVTLATLAMNAVSITLTASVLLRQLPAESRLAIAPGQMAAGVTVTVVAFVGLAAVAASLSLAVTAASKSVKEAQNTLTPVILLVSGLAGVAMLPGQKGSTLLAAVPFTGQIAVAKAALESWRPPGEVLTMLGLSLLSSAVLTWILLRATAVTLDAEDLLFRGPDSAAGPLSRPPRRLRPTPLQAAAGIAAGVALIWYSQGLTIDDLAVAIPVQQVITLLVPMLALTWWQRIAARPTFALRLPVAGAAVRSLPCLAAAAVAGAGLFALGALALLAVRGTETSPESRLLAERLLGLVRGRPWWVGWLLIALLPAVCEELFFRGFVLAGFVGHRPGRGRAMAAIGCQAACFAAFHLLPERMPQTFALGLLLGWMVFRTGSLLPAVVGHVAHNSVPVLLLTLVRDDSLATGAGVPPGLLEPGIVAGAAAALACGLVGFLATSQPSTPPGDDQYQSPARTTNVSEGLSQGVSAR